MFLNPGSRARARIQSPAAVGFGANSRILLRQATTFNVNATTGSDLTGGFARPFATIQAAANFIQNHIDINGQACIVQVASGSYTAGFSLTNGLRFVGGTPTFQGDTTTPANVLIQPSAATNACFQITFDTAVNIQGFKLAGGTNVNYGIYCSGGARANVNNMAYDHIGSTPAANYAAGIHIGANNNGSRIFLNANYSITSSAGAHYQMTNGGTIEVGTALTVTINSTPNFATAFVYCVWNGMGNLGSITFSGSATGQRYNAQYGGTINTAAGGANYFPGNSSGFTGFSTAAGAGNFGNYF